MRVLILLQLCGHVQPDTQHVHEATLGINLAYISWVYINVHPYLHVLPERQSAQIGYLQGFYEDSRLSFRLPAACRCAIMVSHAWMSNHAFHLT